MLEHGWISVTDLEGSFGPPPTSTDLVAVVWLPISAVAESEGAERQTKMNKATTAATAMAPHKIWQQVSLLRGIRRVFPFSMFSALSIICVDLRTLPDAWTSDSDSDSPRSLPKFSFPDDLSIEAGVFCGWSLLLFSLVSLIILLVKFFHLLLGPSLTLRTLSSRTSSTDFGSSGSLVKGESAKVFR